MPNRKKSYSTERKRILKRLEKLVFGNPGDVIKLMYMEQGSKGEAFEGLDLTMLSEVKRGAGGTIEIKLIDRLAALRILLEETESRREQSGAEEFLAALREAPSAKPQIPGGETFEDNEILS